MVNLYIYIYTLYIYYDQLVRKDMDVNEHKRVRLECIYRGFKLQLGQTKDYNISICCFTAKLAALRRKSKDWLAWNQVHNIH
jgi:hypothetical protein